MPALTRRVRLPIDILENLEADKGRETLGDVTDDSVSTVQELRARITELEKRNQQQQATIRELMNGQAGELQFITEKGQPALERIDELENKVQELKSEVRRQEQLAEEFRTTPFEGLNAFQWATEVWKRMSDSQRYDFKKAFLAGSTGLNRRLIGKRDVVKKLWPIANELQEVGMESSGDKLLNELFEALNEWRV